MQQSGSKGVSDKVVEIKSEILATLDDEFARSYTQQYPTIRADNSQPTTKFATLSAKLRSERVQLSCELCNFKCLSRVLLSSHSMYAHSQECKGSGIIHFKCSQCQAVFLTRTGLETHQVRIFSEFYLHIGI